MFVFTIVLKPLSYFNSRHLQFQWLLQCELKLFITTQPIKAYVREHVELLLVLNTDLRNFTVTV